jgi:hypothetical protein
MCSAGAAFVLMLCAWLNPIWLDARHDNGPILRSSAQTCLLVAGCRQVVFTVGRDVAFELAGFLGRLKHVPCDLRRLRFRGSKLSLRLCTRYSHR